MAPRAHVVPAGPMLQFACDTIPVKLLNVPLRHGVVPTAAAVQYPPRLHGLHVVWPVASWNDPASQSAHMLAPDDDEYVPAMHGVGAVDASWQ